MKKKFRFNKHCPTCNGSGVVQCQLCSGHGTIDLFKGKCIQCGGTGLISCPDCRAEAKSKKDEAVA